MPENNTFGTLNNKIIALSKAVKSTEILLKGLDVADEVMHILGIPYDELEKGEDMLEKAFPNSRFNNQKMEKWFAPNPIIDGARVALYHYDKGTYPIESKFYMLSDSPRKEKIAYTTQLFPNWEDGDMYMIPDYKVGVDFFLNPKAKSLLFVVTRKGILRVVEFCGKLSHTQIEILNAIQNCALYDGIDIKTKQPIPFEPQRTIHNTLWNALELRAVNKKFYFGISDHFVLLCQYLKDHVPEGVDPSTIDNTSRIFANRIINRLLFVWFLRKKGIINKDYNYFDIGEDDSSTYYENKLKPLFFNTLNVPIEDRELTGDSVTPYLNGGLFEAHETDWPNTKVPFPTGWFNSLYEHLDKFNFTTDESSAEYEQVAIDPEMLGRVFENLLASIVPETANSESVRNAKGAFYTPREIVSYMCKISLKEYFKRNVSSDKYYPGIDNLIDMSDNDFLKQKSSGMADLWGVSSTQVREQLTGAINNLKILDPACGSGAFPIGMLQLLLKTCERLSLIYDEKLGKLRLISGTEVTNTYLTKLFLIRNCLYGVDIEPMAAEISRLRAWLSLIIDDKTDIEPLPNLDFNFVCANTLIRLPEQLNLFNSEYEVRFQQLRDTYFNTHNKKEKDKLRNEFYQLYKENNEDGYNERFEVMKTWDPFKSTKPASFFDSNTMFNVSKFSIVIGNPPYVQLQSMKEISKSLYKPQGFKTYDATGDMYCLFIEKGMELCQKGGALTFITSNKWMRSGYGKSLRTFLAKMNPVLLIDFGGNKVFESATVDTNIIQVIKEDNEGKTISCSIPSDKAEALDNLSDFVQQNSTTIEFSTNESWTILNNLEKSIKNKIEKSGVPLKEWNVQINYGIKTGLNEAFIISSEKRNEILSHCLTADEKIRTEQIIRPVLRGRDIKRFAYNWSGLYLIATFPSRHYNIDDYPSLKKYLLSFNERVLAQSGEKDIDGIKGLNARKKTCNKWFETQDSIAYWDDFSQPKVFYREISDEMGACYVENAMFINNKAYFIIGEHLVWLCCFFNSLIFKKFIFSTFNQTGGKGPDTLLNIRVPKPSLLQEDSLIKLYNSLMVSDDDAQKIEIENKIDDFFYTVFNLSDSQIDFISKEKS